MSDPVLSPNHYTAGGIEVIDYLRMKLSPEEFAGFCKGNVIKYLSRANHKNGEEDLKKAAFYARFIAGDDPRTGKDLLPAISPTGYFDTREALESVLQEARALRLNVAILPDTPPPLTSPLTIDQLTYWRGRYAMLSAAKANAWVASDGWVILSLD